MTEYLTNLQNAKTENVFHPLGTEVMHISGPALAVPGETKVVGQGLPLVTEGKIDTHLNLTPNTGINHHHKAAKIFSMLIILPNNLSLHVLVTVTGLIQEATVPGQGHAVGIAEGRAAETGNRP